MKRTEIVGGNDDALVVLDADDRGAGDDGRLCVCFGAGGLEVGGIVSAVDVIARLDEAQC